MAAVAPTALNADDDQPVPATPPPPAHFVAPVLQLPPSPIKLVPYATFLATAPDQYLLANSIQLEQRLRRLGYRPFFAAGSEAHHHKMMERGKAYEMCPHRIENDDGTSVVCGRPAVDPGLVAPDEYSYLPLMCGGMHYWWGWSGKPLTDEEKPLWNVTGGSIDHYLGPVNHREYVLAQAAMQASQILALVQKERRADRKVNAIESTTRATFVTTPVVTAAAAGGGGGGGGGSVTTTTTTANFSSSASSKRKSVPAAWKSVGLVKKRRPVKRTKSNPSAAAAAPAAAASAASHLSSSTAAAASSSVSSAITVSDDDGDNDDASELFECAAYHDYRDAGRWESKIVTGESDDDENENDDDA